MRHHTKNRGLFVLVRREGDGNDSLFRWGIYRRRIPFGVKLTEGGFGSYHAALTAGKRPSLNCLSKFSRKKTSHVIKTPRLALAEFMIAETPTRQPTGYLKGFPLCRSRGE